MSTAYARHLGTARHLYANGRLWTIETIDGDRALAEVRRFEHGDNPHNYIHFPPALGFGALETAAHWRGRALKERHAIHRITFKRRAWESIEHSRRMRVTRELLAETREARQASYSIAAE